MGFDLGAVLIIGFAIRNLRKTGGFWVLGRRLRANPATLASVGSLSDGERRIELVFHLQHTLSHARQIGPEE